MKNKMENVIVLNEGNPCTIGEAEGNLFTVSPSTAKKHRAYYSDKPVPLTKYELKMPGVVVAQNRGMLFSSSRPVAGNYIIPELNHLNLIVVDEVNRKLKPVDDENIIAWKGNGEHAVKDVIADGQGQHWFCDADGRFADKLWLKLAKLGYGLKGMLQPGLASDVGTVVVDHWGVERTVTMGDTLLINSSLVKGLGAYDSLEDLITHGEEWGLTTLLKQWQSGDHKPAKRRIMGTQPNATNMALTMDEIMNFLKPEALGIWATKYEEVAWMKAANIHTSRGRALAARPGLMNKDLVMNQIDTKAGNTFLRLAQGKFMAKGEYLKMYMDKLVYSLVYVHGMDPNEAAKKAAATGLHGEIRVNPAFAGYKAHKEDGKNVVEYTEETSVDDKGLYVEVALVRYPHGAPSETIIVRAYLDATVPEDVIVFPAPVANDDGTIPVSKLYAMRLQGADFDGDAVTAFKERAWIDAQKRNAGKSYMVIPVNTESTEKDKTKVTDETWSIFCEQKVDSLSNRVGLIATSLKYFFSQCSELIRDGFDTETVVRTIVDHACAMGDDIDEFKHGKSNNSLVPFVVEWVDKEEILSGPYFNRYAKKYRSEEAFNKAVYNKNGSEKTPGKGVLDMYAVAIERLMEKCGLPIVKEVAKASDGKDRWFLTVHPVKWDPKDVELHIGKGEGQLCTALPTVLEQAYGVKPGTKFSAKDLFLLLYRDHAATCKTLLNTNGDDNKELKALMKINERYALAKITVVAWTKAMKRSKGEEIDSVEALRVFATLMVQHTKNSRSVIETLTLPGSFKKADGSTYEKTVYAAQRCFNYFLDLCGDGLLFIGEQKPEFPNVSEKIVTAANAQAPDMAEARALAEKEADLVEGFVSKLELGLTDLIEEIDNSYNFDPDDFDASVLDDSFSLSDECEEPTWNE